MGKFRTGDLVSINLVVESLAFNNGGDIRLRMPDGGYQDYYAKVSDLAMVKPKFESGDTVTWSLPDGLKQFVGDVLSIAEDHLWISLGEGNYATVWAGSAMRVDDEEPAETDEAA